MPPRKHVAELKHHGRVMGLKLFITLGLMISVSYFCLFFVPAIRGKPMSNDGLLIVYYLFWMVYFWVALLQLRYGYPSKANNPIPHGPVEMNMFDHYHSAPFLWELTTMIDWTVTPTGLKLKQWFQVDDCRIQLIHNTHSNNEDASTSNLLRQPKEKVTKGICVCSCVSFIILLPLILFSNVSPVTGPNPTLVSHLSLSLSSKLPNSTLRASTFPIFSQGDVSIGPIDDDQY